MNRHVGPVYKPTGQDWTVPPGEMLKETLEEAGMTIADLAALTGLAPERIENLIGACVELTEDDAAALERGTKVLARLWLNMETLYRADLAEGRTWPGAKQ